MDFLRLQCLIVVLSCILTPLVFVASYDLLDPYGTINIKWDIMSWTPDGYVAVVTMNNLQMYRHIESPGWSLGWTWAKKEVIWSMLGAQATDQGDCSKFKGNIPHSCHRSPTVVDLLLGVPKNQQFSGCCTGGVLASLGQDPSASASAFQVSVGLSGTSNMTMKLPKNFVLLGPGPGYTCGATTTVPPTVFSSSDGRRKSYAMMTWTVTCMYSQTLASKERTCCVSLSSFYSPKITPCPSCACGCQDKNNCIMSSPKISSVVKSNNPVIGNAPVVQCTQHMCPIRVHWHVKANYKEYWRVKITITNFNHQKNYSQWNLVLQHPNLSNITKIYNFLYKPISLYKPINDTGMFYGVKRYNDLIMEAGPDGNVQTEMILKKNRSTFTLEQGWAFPLKVYFNGDECMMPPPDSFPSLPNSAQKSPIPFSAVATFMHLILLVFWWLS